MPQTLVPSVPVTPAELAELMSAFTAVTARLERTHEDLKLEVARLQDELSHANEQLQRSKRLAALGEMAAGIAHEVRNPLGSIALYARMLDSDLADRPAERSTAAKIAAAVRGLDAVVGDVLSFARELRVSPHDIDASDLIERALDAAASTSLPRVRIERLDQAHPITLRGDPSLLHQALLNIVRNALQAMGDCEPPAGATEHTLTTDTIAGHDGLGAIVVRDTGPGITPDALDRMFNPFFTTRATGTGLGLAIVHRIVDAHAGHIRASNVLHARGAQFELHLPLVLATQESAPAGVHVRARPQTATATNGRRRAARQQSQEIPR